MKSSITVFPTPCRKYFAISISISTNYKQFQIKMSNYTEEYLKNKLVEKLGATHVVSSQWKTRKIRVCFGFVA